MRLEGRKVALIRNTAPDNYGGGETYQLALARMLKENGAEPIIFSSSKRLIEEAKAKGFEAVEAPFYKRQNWSGVYNFLLPVYLLLIARLCSWYKKQFKQYGVDVVNIQSRDDWIAATRAAKSLRIRILWTDHMDFRSWVLQNIDRPLKNFIGKIILREAKKADKIIFISDFEYEYFRSLQATQDLRNLTVIKNGAFDSARDYLKIKDDRRRIAYVGRVVDYKGISELIKAFNIASKRFPDAKLDIYGDGPDIKKYKALAVKNKNVAFLGYTDEPLAAIKSACIFVLPSYREGLSLSLLDAAMMGRCIIASDVDGNPEIVINEKTGLLVPAKNIGGLAAAIERVLEDDALAAKMAKGARKHFEKNFDFEKVFNEKMVGLYE